MLDSGAILRLTAVVTFVGLLLGCSSSATDGFECDLHDVQDEMPGLAKFLGNDPSGGVARAIGKYEEALQHNTISEPHAGFCIGEILISHERYEEAIKWLDRAIAADQSRFEPYFSRAMAYHGIQECDRSLSDLTEAEARGAGGYGLSYNRAKVKIECGDYRKALSDLDSASNDVPGSEHPIGLSLSYAEVYSAIGDFNLASKHAYEVVDRLSGMEECNPQQAFCSSPRLIEAVNILTSVLCEMSREDEASDIFGSYRNYRAPSPNIPECVRD